MSHAISPSEAPGNNGGDDFTGIALDDKYLYAAWADERSKNGGGLSLYFARIPLNGPPAAPPGPSPTPAPRPVPKRPPVCHTHRSVSLTLPKHANHVRVTVNGRPRTLPRHGRTVILNLIGLPRRPVTVLIRARIGRRAYIHARTLDPCIKGPTSPLPPGDAG